MKKKLGIVVLLLSMVSCKSMQILNEKPIMTKVCPDFGFITLSEQEKDSFFEYKVMGGWEQTQTLQSLVKNKDDWKNIEKYNNERDLTKNFDNQIFSYTSVKNERNEIIIFPSSMLVDASSIDSEGKFSAWKYFYFRVCPSEKKISNEDKIPLLIKSSIIKKELQDTYGKKSIRDLILHIQAIDRKLDNLSGLQAKEGLLRKKIAWNYFLNRLDNSVLNFLKNKYTEYYSMAEKPVYFKDRTEYNYSIYTFKDMFRILFRADPTSAKGLAEEEFILEPKKKLAKFNLIHTKITNGSERPVANITFEDAQEEVNILGLLEGSNSSTQNNWQYVSGIFLQECVGKMNSYDFNLDYVNVERFDKYEPK
ncbi:hypothetical protein [Leptospira ellinghausenii]|nr:hypothetical protein [Leptospira ellinghausenii]